MGDRIQQGEGWRLSPSMGEAESTQVGACMMAILHQEISAELHRALKMEAASRSMTLKDLVTGLLTDEMQEVGALEEDEDE